MSCVKGNKNESCLNKKSKKSVIDTYLSMYKNGERLCNMKKCIKINNPLKKDEINKMYKQLLNNIKEVCKKEEDILRVNLIDKIKDNNVKEIIKDYSFKPIGPLNNNWLNTNNINEVEKQYFNKKDSVFLGAHPSDFSKIYKVNYNNIQKIKYVGVVFNLDPHTKGGSHWVSVFIDNKNKTIDYFDSVGNNPNKNIKEFLNKFKKYKLNINKVKHQKGYSECGVYACFFLNMRLKKYTMDEINKFDLSDKNIFNYRKEIFRK